MIPHSNKFNFVTDREQWIEDNKHICTYPYVGAHTKSRWDPCCWYRSTVDFNSSSVTRVKEHIESQKIDAFCYYCTNQEKNNLLSGRQRALLELSPEDLQSFLQNKKLNEFTVTITLSNKCNMACRICGPHLSSLYGQLIGIKNFSSPNLSDNVQYWEEIKNSIKEGVNQYNVYRLTITGGEGTIQNDLYKLVDWLYQQNLSQKINLHLLTNGSTFLEETFSEWQQMFKQIDFGLSIDSVNENYSYVRWPMKFDKLEKNLYQFSEFSKKYKNFTYFITPTFYINNIAYLPEWLEFFEKFYNAGNNFVIFDNTFVEPNFLAIANLPTYLKNNLLTIIEPLPNLDLNILKKNTQFRESMHNIIEQLKMDLEIIPSQQFKQQELWREYLQQTAKWDLLTNTSLPVSNQKLWDRLSGQDQLYYRELLQQSL